MQSKFYTPLKVEVLADGRRRKLIDDLIYYSELLNQYLCVPADFITDYASIPRIFWNILPPSGKYTKAAVLHDYIYNSGIFNKKTADSLFKEAMKALEVDGWKVNAMYYGVDWFGFMAWNNYRKESSNGNK